MKRVLRRSMLWLIILLMPLQAMAGFVMPHGAMLGPSPPAGLIAPSAPTLVLHPPCHGAMSMQSRPHSAAAGAMHSIATHDVTPDVQDARKAVVAHDAHDARHVHNGNDTAEAQDPRQDSPGLCLSCCLMLVLPSSIQPKATLASSLAKPVPTSGRPRSHIPGGLDRPPRPRLA